MNVSILLESKFDLGFYCGNKSYGKIFYEMACIWVVIILKLDLTGRLITNLFNGQLSCRVMCGVMCESCDTQLVSMLVAVDDGRLRIEFLGCR